ncbi:MAG: nuclear transport factor 2 family protein [Rhizomicrobium sp.]
MMSPVDKLLAIEEIRLLKARYFRFVDSHDWAGYRTLFADDAVFISSGFVDPATGSKRDGSSPIGAWPQARIEGADAIVAWASGGLADAHTVHTGFMPEIEILTPDSARGLWAMQDIVRWPGRVLTGHGYYKEAYMRRNGVWLILTVELVRKSLLVDDVHTTGGCIV